jgi:hypothetical protein
MIKLRQEISFLSLERLWITVSVELSKTSTLNPELSWFIPTFSQTLTFLHTSKILFRMQILWELMKTWRRSRSPTRNWRRSPQASIRPRMVKMISRHCLISNLFKELTHRHRSPNSLHKASSYWVNQVYNSLSTRTLQTEYEIQLVTQLQI